MNLHYYLNKEGKKIYTLKKTIGNRDTEEAHYKFLKFTEFKKEFSD